jgi:hypothetical protein
MGGLGMASRKSILLVLFVSLVFLIPNGGVVATEYDAAGDVDETRVVERMSYDSYRLRGNGRIVDITLKVKSGGQLDIYLLSDSQYVDYKNPFAPSFNTVESSQKVRSFSWSGKDVSHVLVVDNDLVSQSGAIPLNNETYEISISYSEIPVTENILGFILSPIGGFLIVAILVAGTITYLFSVPKKYREKASRMKNMYK